MSKAFTLIELLVVVSIVVILTALILPNYRAGDDQFAILRIVHQVSQDLRRSQELAISVEDFNGNMPGGYGVHFSLNEGDRYIIFADLDGDRVYSGPNERVEEIIFEGAALISSLNPVSAGNSLDIFFAPPDPVIYFFPDGADAVIKVQIKSLEKSIQVNKAGLIFAE